MFDAAIQARIEANSMARERDRLNELITEKTEQSEDLYDIAYKLLADSRGIEPCRSCSQPAATTARGLFIHVKTGRTVCDPAPLPIRQRAEEIAATGMDLS